MDEWTEWERDLLAAMRALLAGLCVVLLAGLAAFAWVWWLPA